MKHRSVSLRILRNQSAALLSAMAVSALVLSGCGSGVSQHTSQHSTPSTIARPVPVRSDAATALDRFNRIEQLFTTATSAANLRLQQHKLVWARMLQNATASYGQANSDLAMAQQCLADGYIPSSCNAYTTSANASTAQAEQDLAVVISALNGAQRYYAAYNINIEHAIASLQRIPFPSTVSPSLSALVGDMNATSQIALQLASVPITSATLSMEEPTVSHDMGLFFQCSGTMKAQSSQVRHQLSILAQS